MSGYRGTILSQPRAGWIVASDKAERRNRRRIARLQQRKGKAR